MKSVLSSKIILGYFVILLILKPKNIIACYNDKSKILSFNSSGNVICNSILQNPYLQIDLYFMIVTDKTITTKLLKTIIFNSISL